ncbi:MAG: SCP2 sterol-binding domain-containing protein [Methylovulum sp.]|uniref:ubiquinone biosynthesis accessory factor UbiJ n=1 Tax=Methylovulum sp. TaxID=1916980 RepID=UPI00261104F7|nr:SCP2 sterol-binding domain-containing protein [Methylovulum sp.]MDD2724839.1 SCP2 sterol-binding domain-containing protein [Methylovulum sp.]MDD5124949.1 SCP2 sterol-binding domain-containing protein [Methylovulum sp.]
MLVKPLLLGVLETAFREYLALDVNSPVLLAPMVGKVIAVTITPFGETLYLCPATDTIQLIDQYPDEPDTHLTGSLLAFGLMGISDKPMRSIFSGEVKIDGDMHTGRRFQELFAKLDINLENKLARYTGERFAHNLSQWFRAGQDWSKETLETFRLNTAEFLQEETRDLPAVPEADIFYQYIDDLRLDFDRLQSRVERLENQLK